ncbi:MAG: mandelate racemase [Pseudomonadota bacterium]
MAVKLKVVESSSGIRNVFMRMPFRFGVITKTASPQLTLAVEIEDPDGRRATGYAADFLAYRWFDKRPAKTLADNCQDLIQSVHEARDLYLEAGREGFATPFDLWRRTYPEIVARGLARDFNKLGASFGASMFERCIIDAAGRLTGQTYAALVRSGLGIDLGRMCEELRGQQVDTFLPAQPLQHLHLRHTVGLVDPISAADRAGDPINDGLPETLEDYLDKDGIRYLKVKIAGNADEDIDRLNAIAAVLDRREGPFYISLDGNEQHKQIGDFVDLIARIRATPSLERFYQQIMFIEQPLDRSVALDPSVEAGLRELPQDKPVIIDEADGWPEAFREAIALGYRGTSHKNCKGIYKSLQNIVIASTHNARVGRQELFMSAEDLSVVPVVALQADLASVALLGITHVERNGHHYFRGMGHLSEPEKAAALAAHPDLYERRGDETFLKVKEGMIACASIQVPGMGFACVPDMDRLTPVDAWSFDSLGIQQ